MKLDDQLGSNGKYLGKRNGYLPTRKTHCAYGDVNHDLTHNDREWKCRCGATVQRDVNAALIIKHGRTMSCPPSHPLDTPSMGCIGVLVGGRVEIG